MNQIPLPPKQGETMLIPRAASEDEALLHMIERLARDPSVDLDRFERLVGLRNQAGERTAMVAYNDALAKLQGELDPVIKRGQGFKISPNSKGQPYALLEDVIAELKPKLARHGFSVQFDTEDIDENWIQVTTILRHGGGHCWQTKKKFPIDRTGSKNPTQAHGSTISYSRRYGLMVCFNMATADEDDDAVAAGRSEPISAEQLLELENLVESTGSDMGLFCKKLNVTDLAHLPVTRLNEAVDLLELKRRANERTAKSASASTRKS